MFDSNIHTFLGLPAREIPDGDLRIILDEFMNGNDALVLEIGFPVGEEKLNQHFGLSVNNKKIESDPFDVGFRYSQHQRLRVQEAQEIIDCF